MAEKQVEPVREFMPVYRFYCSACGKEFDKILKTKDTTSVTCTFCGSMEIERTTSAVSFLQKSGTGIVPAGALSGGSCRSGFS
ncbi:zinc ribbon domain-containing protein [Desulfopila sp. IMCC35008]|uniref:FmdB family zinc ribbon protein n=1 Tax=Desulfopila sp. IMCC35008 TaxID=2653858 RepID=UPI0013D58835|nr:zinc ribbon domain-containing protein [Desulfopila sp. IMCC35008]